VLPSGGIICPFSVRKKQLLGSQRPPNELEWPLRATGDPWAAYDP